MRSLSRCACVLATAAAAAGAHAEGYAGIAVGQSNVRLDCSGTITCDTTDTAFKVFGGYMVLPFVGMEAAYFRQGKAKLTAVDTLLGSVNGTFKGDGYGAYAVGRLPLDTAHVYGKLGVVSAKIWLDATSSAFGSAGSAERHTNAAWALGAAYDFDRSWSGRMEYERVRVKFMDEKLKVHLVTLDALYRF